MYIILNHPFSYKYDMLHNFVCTQLKVKFIMKMYFSLSSPQNTIWWSTYIATVVCLPLQWGKKLNGDSCRSQIVLFPYKQLKHFFCLHGDTFGEFGIC